MPETIVRGIEFGDYAASKRLANLCSVGVPVAGSIAALFWFRNHPFTWAEATSFLVFYVISGVGIGIGMHRTFSHQAIGTSLFLKLSLAIAGSMAFQGPIIRWVADHRRHHRYTDVLGDTHSPHTNAEHAHPNRFVGLIYAHLGWLFDRTTSNYQTYAPDVLRDPILMFFSRIYWPMCCISLILPAMYGYAWGGIESAIGCLLIGGCLRTVALHNTIWAVNSIGHSFGTQGSSTRDSSRNNLLLAILTFGEGWHNNHHAKPRSAFNDWNWTQFDLNGHIIRLLLKLGLAKDAVYPEDLRGQVATADAEIYDDRVTRQISPGETESNYITKHSGHKTVPPPQPSRQSHKSSPKP